MEKRPSTRSCRRKESSGDLPSQMVQNIGGCDDVIEDVDLQKAYMAYCKANSIKPATENQFWGHLADMGVQVTIKHQLITCTDLSWVKPNLIQLHTTIKSLQHKLDNFRELYINSFKQFLKENVYVTRLDGDVIMREELVKIYTNYCTEQQVPLASIGTMGRILSSMGVRANVRRSGKNGCQQMYGYRGLIWVKDITSNQTNPCTPTAKHSNDQSLAKLSFLKFFGEKLVITNKTTDLVLQKDFTKNYKKFCQGKGMIQANFSHVGQLMHSFGVNKARYGEQGDQRNVFIGLTWAEGIVLKSKPFTHTKKEFKEPQLD